VVGQQAVPFSMAGNSLGEELSLCQRYFEKSYAAATPPGSATSTGVVICTTEGDSSGNHYFSIRYKVNKRSAAHTVTPYEDTGGSPNSVRAFANNINQNGTYFTGTASCTVGGTSEGSFYAYGFTYATYGNGRVVFHWTADAEL
jgi:hypothetical protein